MRNVLKREYNGFYAVIVIFTLLEIVSDFVADGHVEFDAMWAGIFAVGTIAFIVLRTLRRRTEMLSVEGR